MWVRWGGSPTSGGERHRQACSISNEVNTAGNEVNDEDEDDAVVVVPLIAAGGKVNRSGGWVMRGLLEWWEEGWSAPSKAAEAATSLSSKSTK